MHRAPRNTGNGVAFSALVLGCLFLVLLAPQEAWADVKATFAYRLSDFSGPVSSLWAKVAVDDEFDEVYALNINDGLVQIYNGTAMQIHEYGEEYGLASATDLAIGENGDAYIAFGRRKGRELLKLDYRGAPVGEFGLSGIPAEYRPFQPIFIDYRDGSLYLADSRSLRFLEVSPEGRFQRGYDFRKTLESLISAPLKDPELRESRKRKIERELKALEGAELGGFSVDSRGNMYFTLPVLFSAYKVTADGQIEGFGLSGGGKGKFGVIAGIDSDEYGNIYIADRLRCVVLVFDRELKFQTEFGYRGPFRHNLVVPEDLAVDAANGKVYVSQAANLGVSVFRLRFEQQEDLISEK